MSTPRGKRAAPTPDPATDYARSVVAGEVVTGKLVTLACRRHLADLETGGGRGLYFDREEAAAALDFWRLCPHVKGDLAGEPIEPEPWQCFLIGSIYGWKKAGGRRRFRVAWVELARKNGKSTIAYPAALHGITVDGEGGAEVYSVATKKDQAKIVYGLARRAAIRVPEFAAAITPYRDTLQVEATDSKFEALASDSDTLDGLNPSVVICDEVHKWKGGDLWDVIDTATGARSQPLILVVTTAGRDGSEDVYGREHEYTRQVLEGVVQDDSRFGFIACLDPEDDWQDPKNFVKANPNLGVSVQAADILRSVRKAKKTPATAAGVKRLCLGIRAQDADAWLPLPLWDAGRADVDWAAFKGAACGAGLDLASSCDFAALCLCFPAGEDLRPAADFDRPWGYLLRWRLWLPEGWASPAGERLRVLAGPWAPEWVTLTPGDVIDQDAIEAACLETAAEFDVKGLCFDPWNAEQLSQHLQADGVNVQKFQQRMQRFAAPCKRYGELLMGRRLRHDGNPCARWMANNCVVVSNGAGQMMPSRKKSRNKIDGVVASVMALDACVTVDDTGGFINPTVVRL